MVKDGVDIDELELPADTSTNDAEMVEQPEVVKEWSDYTEEELLSMSDPEFFKLVDASKRGGKNVPRMLIILTGKRKLQQ